MREQRELEARQQVEELKASEYSYEGYGSQAKETKQVKKVNAVKSSQFIAITEKIGREEMSRMIGEKVIGKVFADNLEDFKGGQDMGPIVMICSIITKILVLVKELDVKQRAQIESNVIYRSHILHILYAYLSNTFSVKSFNNERISDNDDIMKRIKRDQELLNIFAFIVSRRLVVIDDVEFQGKNKVKVDYPFLPFSEIRFVSWLLNNIAYRVFLTE